jgi:hypothetical protein
VRSDVAERQRRLIVGVEIGPVHGDDEFPALAQGVIDPEREHGPDVDPLVAQETIDLLAHDFRAGRRARDGSSLKGDDNANDLRESLGVEGRAFPAERSRPEALSPHQHRGIRHA